LRLSTTPSHPAVTAFDIDDLTAAHADMDVVERDGMTLESTGLRARRVVVRLESTVVAYQSVNLRVRAHTRTRDGLLGYCVFGPRSVGTVDGLQIRPGTVLVAPPETAAAFVVEPGWESITVMVRPDDLRAHLAARRREDEFHEPDGVEVLHASPDRGGALFRMGRRLTAIAARRPALFEVGGAARDAAEAELLDVLLGTLRSADGVAPSSAERTQQARSRIVQIAEDYVLAHGGERVYVSHLCREADVSERTLESIFQEVVGMSPTAYLTRLRLHRVRAALLAAEPGSTRVATEAVRWGFWHFGDFSRAYKRCFGESPSDTLRRPPAAHDLGSSTETTNQAPDLTMGRGGSSHA
jgi:AraC-like DNA-binding protein